MESSEAASRRMRCIASHLAATPQNSCSSSLATTVCSSSSGSQSSRRKDGRLLYARQNSHVPPYLKEPKDSQGSNAGSATQAISRKDNRLMFARQGCHTRAYFMREHTETQVMSSMEKKDTCSQCLLYNIDNLNKASSDLNHSLDKRHDTNGEPFFARPLFEVGNEGLAEKLAFKEVQTTHAKSKLDWHPRMDIAESKVAFIVTIELPGVNADGIRVEVNNDRLLVSGSRSINLWVDIDKQNEEAVYHRREVSQGPFRVHWPIPKNSNLESISAEFMDGFLWILVPKNAL